MATRYRYLRPLLYTTVAAAAGGGALYISYRPRHIPGSDAALVPPPKYGEEGHLEPPKFPLVKSREDQIADLKRSGGALNALQKTKLTCRDDAKTEKATSDEADVYDLLVIGGGATGTGIALDAATRGLKVAMVERDDFASGTSSKSTKLVHGGVRYLEKAVWELDYSQYGCLNTRNQRGVAEALQVQAGQGSFARKEVLLRHCASSVELASNHDTNTKVVAGAIFLGRY